LAFKILIEKGIFFYVFDFWVLIWLKCWFTVACALGIKALFELFLAKRSGAKKASAESPTRRVTPKNYFLVLSLSSNFLANLRRKKNMKIASATKNSCR
jgi:hypothetical protein